jgi:hypothetical protein
MLLVLWWGGGLGGMCWDIEVVMRSIGMGRGGRGNEVDETGIGIGIDQWGLKKVSCILSILFLDYWSKPMAKTHQPLFSLCSPP